MCKTIYKIIAVTVCVALVVTSLPADAFALRPTSYRTQHDTASAVQTERDAGEEVATNKKLAVIIYPQKDIFDIETWLFSDIRLKRNIKMLEVKGYQVIAKRVKAVDEFVTSLLSVKASHGGVDLLHISGHGTRTSVMFGNGPLGVLSIEDETIEELEKVKDVLKPKGTIIFNSCSTGEGEQREKNIANAFREYFPQAKHIFAPTAKPTFSYYIFDASSKDITGVRYSKAAYRIALSLIFPLAYIFLLLLEPLIGEFSVRAAVFLTYKLYDVLSVLGIDEYVFVNLANIAILGVFGVIMLVLFPVLVIITLCSLRKISEHRYVTTGSDFLTAPSYDAMEGTEEQSAGGEEPTRRSPGKNNTARMKFIPTILGLIIGAAVGFPGIGLALGLTIDFGPSTLKKFKPVSLRYVALVGSALSGLLLFAQSVSAATDVSISVEAEPLSLLGIPMWGWFAGLIAAFAVWTITALTFLIKFEIKNRRNMRKLTALMHEVEGESGKQGEVKAITHARNLLRSLRPDFKGKEELTAEEFEDHVRKMAKGQGINYIRVQEGPIKFAINHLKFIYMGLETFKRRPNRDSFIGILASFIGLMLLYVQPRARWMMVNGQDIFSVSIAKKTAFVTPLIALIVSILLFYFFQGQIFSFIFLVPIIWYTGGTFFNILQCYAGVNSSFLRHELKHLYIWLLLEKLKDENIIDVSAGEAGSLMGIEQGMKVISREKISIAELERLEDKIIETLVAKTEQSRPPSGSSLSKREPPAIKDDELATALAAAAGDTVKTKPSEKDEALFVQHELPAATPKKIDLIAETFALAA